MKQSTLFPDHETPQQIEQRALNHLPIKSKNDLIALLRSFENALQSEEKTLAPPSDKHH